MRTTSHNVSPDRELSMKRNECMCSYFTWNTDVKENYNKNLLCSLDYVPCAVIINMRFPSKRFTISMVVMALGFDFLLKSKSHKGKSSEERYRNISIFYYHFCTVWRIIIIEIKFYLVLKSVLFREKACSIDLPLVHTLKIEKLWD